MLICGVDPGAKGGLAIVEAKTRSVIALHPWGGPGHLSGVLNDLKPDYAVVEKVGAMPGQGVVSMFNFGRVYGEVIGVLAALKIPHELVPPRKWRKLFTIIGEGKEANYRCIKALYPTAVLIPGRCRVPHSGLVDALLLAEYGVRTFVLASRERGEPAQGSALRAVPK